MTTTPLTLVPLTDRALVRLSGEDAVPFLQGLVSCDVAPTAEGRAVWGALLTPQGKFLFDLFVVPDGADLLLDVDAPRREDFVRRLSLYKLRSKVTLAPEPALSVAALVGAEALTTLDLTPGACTRPDEDVLALGDPRAAAMGARLLGTPAALDPLATRLGAARGNRMAYDLWRLPQGVPDGAHDMPPEKTFLLENGFDELGGVGWNKGCFMGQELTARTRYRALVKKRLIPLATGDATLTPGASVRDDEGRIVGEVRTTAPGWALALLKLEALAGTPALTVPALTVDEAPVTPQPAAWMRLPTPPTGS